MLNNAVLIQVYLDPKGLKMKSYEYYSADYDLYFFSQNQLEMNRRVVVEKEEDCYHPDLSSYSVLVLRKISVLIQSTGGCHYYYDCHNRIKGRKRKK